jgi:hypothetical protein
MHSGQLDLVFFEKIWIISKDFMFRIFRKIAPKNSIFFDFFLNFSKNSKDFSIFSIFFFEKWTMFMDN